MLALEGLHCQLHGGGRAGGGRGNPRQVRLASAPLPLPWSRVLAGGGAVERRAEGSSPEFGGERRAGPRQERKMPTCVPARADDVGCTVGRPTYPALAHGNLDRIESPWAIYGRDPAAPPLKNWEIVV